MARIYNISPSGLGTNGQEIADWVNEYLQDLEINPETFSAMEGELITKACKELDWTFVPQSGGLDVEWEEV